MILSGISLLESHLVLAYLLAIDSNLLVQLLQPSNVLGPRRTRSAFLHSHIFLPSKRSAGSRAHQIGLWLTSKPISASACSSLGARGLIPAIRIYGVPDYELRSTGSGNGRDRILLSRHVTWALEQPIEAGTMHIPPSGFSYSISSQKDFRT